MTDLPLGCECFLLRTENTKISENLRKKCEIWCASRSCERPHRLFWTASALRLPALPVHFEEKSSKARAGTPAFPCQHCSEGLECDLHGGYLKNAPILGSGIRAQIELSEKLYEAFKAGFQKVPDRRKSIACLTYLNGDFNWRSNYAVRVCQTTFYLFLIIFSHTPVSVYILLNRFQRFNFPISPCFRPRSHRS